jgi:hypothetical protein
LTLRLLMQPPSRYHSVDNFSFVSFHQRTFTVVTMS